MPHDTPLIATIAMGLVLAFLLGSLAHRLRLSPIVGYLLAGVLTGPFTPGFVADPALAGELAEIGVILLMFGVGLHFSLEDLLEVRKTAIPGALAGIAAATAFGWLLAWALGWSAMQGFVFGLALSVASTVVLLRSLEDHRLLSTPRGKIAIGWVIVEDLVMVLALVFLPALAHSMTGTGGFEIGKLLTSLGVTLGKLAIFVTLMLLVGRRAIPWMLERVAGIGSRELFTLAILAIALGVAFGSAKLFGVSFALGAFFAGMLLNESELSHRAAADSLPMRDAFAVLFFVSVGMLFDPMIIVQQPLPVLATFLIITIGKPIVAYLVVRAFGHPNKTALTISASLAQIGEFSFILAGLGVGLGLLPAAGRDLVLAGALLSIMVNPMMFAALATTNWFSEMETSKPYFFSMFLSAWYIDCVNARSLCALGAISATFSCVASVFDGAPATGTASTSAVRAAVMSRSLRIVIPSSVTFEVCGRVVSAGSGCLNLLVCRAWPERPAAGSAAPP